MRKEKRGISALDGVLILLVILASVGFISQFVLSDGLETGTDYYSNDNEPEEISVESIGPKTPVDEFSWTSSIKNNGTISFEIEIESEKALKIGIYRIENSEMISIYEDWKYPSETYPYNISISVSIGKTGETPEAGEYVLVVRNTENEKVLQKVREWKRGKVHFNIESASPDGKIKMNLSWSSNMADNPKKELNLIIADVEVYIKGEKRKITKAEFSVGPYDDWHEFSGNNIAAIGHPFEYEQKTVRIFLSSDVEEGPQPTKIVFRDAYGSKVKVFDQNVAYV